MPIFQDPDRVLSSYQPWLEEEPSSGDDDYRDSSRSRNWKEPETMDVDMSGTSPVDRETSNYSPPHRQTSDRGELIQSIKRGENPTWVPNRSVSCHILLLPPLNTIPPKSLERRLRKGEDIPCQSIMPTRSSTVNRIHSGYCLKGCYLFCHGLLLICPIARRLCRQ